MQEVRVGLQTGGEGSSSTIYFFMTGIPHAKETGEYFHGFTHPRTAMRNAEIYFQVTEMEKNMIICHMAP